MLVYNSQNRICACKSKKLWNFYLYSLVHILMSWTSTRHKHRLICNTDWYLGLSLWTWLSHCPLHCVVHFHFNMPTHYICLRLGHHSAVRPVDYGTLYCTHWHQCSFTLLASWTCVSMIVTLSTTVYRNLCWRLTPQHLIWLLFISGQTYILLPKLNLLVHCGTVVICRYDCCPISSWIVVFLFGSYSCIEARNKYWN